MAPKPKPKPKPKPSRSGARRNDARPGRDARDRDEPRDARDRRDPRAPDALGGEQVEGRRAVVELLRAGNRRVKAVWMSSQVEPDDTIAEIEELAGAALRVVGPERLGGLVRTETHQGVMATAAPLRPASLDDLLGAPDAFLVALDGVTDPHNLGAVLRNAETAGATGAIIPRHRAARVTPTVAKAAAGAIEYLPIALVGGVPAALDRARRAQVWTVGLDGDGDVDLAELTVSDQPLVLVLGAEGRGLSPLTRKRCDVIARIPMFGHLESLNVSAAAAIACHAIAAGRASAERQ